jgi:hypothetical protein
MGENKFDEKKAQEECTKAIQSLMDNCHFHTPEDAGKTLGGLIMQATMALDQILGSDYAARTLMQVAMTMETGEPQKRAHVEIIKRSQIN